jgi:hypothetical protein
MRRCSKEIPDSTGLGFSELPKCQMLRMIKPIRAVSGVRIKIVNTPIMETTYHEKASHTFRLSFLD